MTYHCQRWQRELGDGLTGLGGMKARLSHRFESEVWKLGSEGTRGKDGDGECLFEDRF